MKLILNILLILGMSNALIAQTVPTEIDVLEQNYKRAVERATKSLNEQYKKELYKLLEKYSKQGKIKEVEHITSLLRDTSPPSSSDSLEKSEWKSITGTIWQFLSKGRGIKTNGNNQTPFTWRRVGDIVEITGRDSLNSPERKWWAKEQSLDIIKYGDEMFLLDGTLKRSSN